MLTVLAYGLAIAINLFIIFIGARFLLAPEAAAAGYGVPSKPSAYLSVKGDRDITYGLVGLALLAFAGVQAEAWFMLVVALAPFGSNRPAKRRQQGDSLRHPLRHRNPGPDQRRPAVRPVTQHQCRIVPPGRAPWIQLRNRS